MKGGTRRERTPWVCVSSDFSCRIHVHILYYIYIHTHTHTFGLCRHIHTYINTYIHTHTYTRIRSMQAMWSAAILIIIEGQFQGIQRLSSSKLVLKTVESCFVALNYCENGSSMCEFVVHRIFLERIFCRL